MKPWARGPFELIEHAEMHATSGTDFDRRMALISFDNAIEMAIVSYLALDPIQRGNQHFARSQVSAWLHNFHSKLDFVEYFVTALRSKVMEFERAEIIFYHKLRNEIYHSGIGVVPAERYIRGIRAVAFWIFNILFDEDAEVLLAQSKETPSPPLEQIPSAQFARAPSEVPSGTDISTQARFLESFLQMRHDLNILMRTVRKEASGPEQDFDAAVAWKELFPPDEDRSARFEHVLSQAETLRRRIVEDEVLETSESDLADLSQRLNEVSSFVTAELRSFQRDIVHEALRATAVASSSTPPRRAGIVWQTAGSGITNSLISYIQGVLSLPNLENPIVIVASDRTDLREQTYRRFADAAKKSAAFGLQICDNSSFVIALRSNRKKVLFTTTQRILSIRDRGPFLGDNVVLVGHDIHGTHRLVDILPNAVFILFTSSFLPMPETSGIFGELIAEYSLKRAIEDKISSPVVCEVREITTDLADNRLLSEEFKTDRFSPFKSAQYIHRVARDILSHFESRDEGVQKAVIVTLSLEVQLRLFSAICSLRPEWTEQQVISPISSAVDPHTRDLGVSRIKDPRDSFKIAMISAGFLAGIDTREVKTVYLVGHLPQVALVRAVDLVSRGVEKGPGLVVDYGDNVSALQSLLSVE
jgi:hypothetical protein